jgi:anti-sigma B factor antagonist
MRQGDVTPLRSTAQDATEEHWMGDRATVAVEQLPGVRVVSAEGELDLANVGELSMALHEAVWRGADDDVVIDLCGVTFIDSVGVSTLVNALRRLTRQNRGMAIACVPGPVLRIFEIARLNGTFRICESREAAIAALRGA